MFRTLRWIAGRLLGLGPARQGFRTVSGPEGSSTKEYTLGAAGVPGLSNLPTIAVFYLLIMGNCS